jgi:hypothetical protein
MKVCFMLNLPVMMHTGLNVVFLFLSILMSFWPQAGGKNTPEITSPSAGQALKGAVLINGHTAVKGFQSAEVSYSYVKKSNSWFLISQSREAVDDGKLAVWDTSTITDGDYFIRLQVMLSDGSVLEKQIQVRVRNYSPVETETPVPTVGAMEAKPTPTLTPTLYHQPTPTPMPANPVRLTAEDLLTSMRVGIVLAIVLFVLLALYFLRKRSKRLK